MAERAPLGIGARYYDQQTMRESDYSFQMERSENIYLNIAAAQSGVGGINSWSAAPLDKYRLNKKAYAYSYRLLPISGKVSKALAKRASVVPSDVMELAKPDEKKLIKIEAPKWKKSE